MTFVVLGWDGLDFDLIDRYGVRGFGQHVSALETIVNSDLEKPHTFEIWPSVITGTPPDVHGIDAAEYVGNSGRWDLAILNTAQRLSTPLPDSIRWAVGRRIRDAGASFDFEDASYYDDLWTVFDQRDSLSLAIPNYRSRTDDELGMATDRGAQLKDYLETEWKKGMTVQNPTVSPERFSQRVAGDAAEKLGIVQTAVGQNYDLVFVWLSYLDTMGHVAPTVNDPARWMRQAYETAAQWTHTLRSTTDADVMAVSDHGLQDGAHTTTACAASDHGAVSELEHVLDVAGLVDDLAPRSGTHDRYSKRERPEVAERLADLGYI